MENFFTDSEESLIWKELEFLNSNKKLLGPEKTSSAELENGLFGKQNRGIFLDDVYSTRSLSNILEVNRKIFNINILQELSKLDYCFQGIVDCNQDHTLLSYYEHGGKYLPHRDSACFTILYWFYKEPKKFIGGELLFSDHNIKIEIANNKMILFPSSFTHEVSEVFMDDSAGEGDGRYCISQFLTINPNKR
jgi:Rps23 Pro-64 3,4-dihydroxylase Tpa1-like proline 4-hydroxylase